ncbi:hypothetical protein HPP92_009680 [Vanilla planifolia]|uniref:DUF4408 domain-containing protein n=1 Tax=Vanilla planifolia TaxID=51239 RepID=A0A835R4N7_VANPL|nr:hypothetical protein HPP92_009680 [Vanilla planifolia]
MGTEKETILRRFRGLLHIRQHLPCLQSAAALLLLSYFSYALVFPALWRNSGEVIYRATAVVSSPGFVFLLGNAIVFVLFAKSGQISPSSSAEDASVWSGDGFTAGSGEICRELSFPPPPSHLTRAEEVAYEDKEVCVEIRSCSRSVSEKFERIRVRRELRREKSEINRSPVAAHDRGAAREDAEEFRRMIDEFIARHRRFRREESLAVLACSSGVAQPVVVNKKNKTCSLEN